MTPHDQLFRAAFSDPTRAAELLRYLLPPATCAVLDFSSLQAAPGSFIDERLREHCTDLLFHIQLRGQTACIYTLIEHKSSEDRRVGLQLLRYMANIWQSFADRQSQAADLPAILPVVVHHGNEAWSSPTTFHPLVHDLSNLPDDIQAGTPNFRFTVFDLATLGENTLAAMASSALTRLALLILQHARTAPNLYEFLHAYHVLFHEVSLAANGGDALLRIFSYLAWVRGASDTAALHTITAQLNEGTSMQTIAEMWEQQGRVKGRQEGRQELLRRQLERRFGQLPADVDTRLATADAVTLLRWADNIVTATSLDDFFAEQATP